MIGDAKMLRDFENDLIRNAPADVYANFRIIDALYGEAVGLGVFPLKDRMDGLDTIIRVAKVVNSVPGANH
jgi:hypothetical protein